MRKQTIQHTTPLDALIAVTKRLSAYEGQQKMDSETFFARYGRGEMGDDRLSVEWANDYRHYLALRRELEERLQDVVTSQKPEIEQLLWEAEEAAGISA